MGLTKSLRGCGWCVGRPFWEGFLKSGLVSGGGCNLEGIGKEGFKGGGWRDEEEDEFVVRGPPGLGGTPSTPMSRFESSRKGFTRW